MVLFYVQIKKKQIFKVHKTSFKPFVSHPSEGSNRKIFTQEQKLQTNWKVSFLCVFCRDSQSWLKRDKCDLEKLCILSPFLIFWPRKVEGVYPHPISEVAVRFDYSTMSVLVSIFPTGNVDCESHFRIVTSVWQCAHQAPGRQWIMSGVLYHPVTEFFLIEDGWESILLFSGVLGSKERELCFWVGAHHS